MVYHKWFNYLIFPFVRWMKGKGDGRVALNLIIYLLNRLLCYSPWAVVTDGCWEVKWAKCLVRMLPPTKADAHCKGNLCQTQIKDILFKWAIQWIKMDLLDEVDCIHLCYLWHKQKYCTWLAKCVKRQLSAAKHTPCLTVPCQSGSDWISPPLP